jgi:hypothetical protein
MHKIIVESLMGREHLEVLVINGRITLKSILKEGDLKSEPD